MAEVQLSGPLTDDNFTDDQWVAIFGSNTGIVGDTDGTAYDITLPPASDTVEIGSATIDSRAVVCGYGHTIPAGTTQSLVIPASTNPTIGRTDLIVARFDSGTFTADPGPVRLVRIPGTEGSAALPSHDTTLPSPVDLVLYAITRKQGEGLNQAAVVDRRSRSGWHYLVPLGGTLPQTAPLGSRATRSGSVYRRDIVGASVDWVEEWGPTNAVAATVYDTGWINLSMTTGWKATTGQTPQVRRIGPVVYIRGRVETISGDNVSGSHTPCFIPATTLGSSCFPSRDHDYVQQVNVSGGSYRIWVDTGGAINTLGFPSENNLYIATSYAVD